MIRDSECAMRKQRLLRKDRVDRPPLWLPDQVLSFFQSRMIARPIRFEAWPKDCPARSYPVRQLQDAPVCTEARVPYGIFAFREFARVVRSPKSKRSNGMNGAIPDCSKIAAVASFLCIMLLPADYRTSACVSADGSGHPAGTPHELGSAAHEDVATADWDLGLKDPATSAAAGRDRQVDFGLPSLGTERFSDTKESADKDQNSVRVVIYRSDTMYKPSIFINDVEICRLQGKRFMESLLPPGTYTFESARDNQLRLELRPREQRFLRVWYGIRKYQIKEVPPEQAQKEMKTTVHNSPEFIFHQGYSRGKILNIAE